jgi:chromate transporter
VIPDGTAPGPSRLGEVARLFLKLGIIGFGGPAAHIAMMRDEVVRRRRWVSDERFLDLLGMTNLVPGPNSTEMAIHLGYARAGWPGLVLGGSCFIVPAMLIVLALAWLYVRYGTAPAATSALYGVIPVILAIVTQAMWALARTAVKGPLLGALGLAALALSLAGFNELALLFGGGALVVLARLARRPRLDVAALAAVVGLPGIALGQGMVAAAPVSLPTLALVFLKIGATLYGGGYVLLAFLRNDLVDRLGWLGDRQLLDAIAIGQVTPGPVFTTATFIGFVLAGWTGAVLATIAIFLPSFVFVALLTHLVGWMRASPTLGAVLDGVNAAAVALIAGVSLHLAGDAVVDILTLAIAAAAGVALWRTRVNSAWLVAGGAAIGVVHALVS